MSNEFKLLFVRAEISFDRSSHHFYSFVNGFCIVPHCRRNIRCVHAFYGSNRPVATLFDMRPEQHPSRMFGIHLPNIKTAVPLHAETKTLIITIDDKINRIICDLGVYIAHPIRFAPLKSCLPRSPVSKSKVAINSQYLIVFVSYFYRPIVFRRGSQYLSPVFNGNGIVAFNLTAAKRSYPRF